MICQTFNCCMKVAHGDKCSVAWNQVQRPLAAGGLGIPDLELMGKALRLRWLWKQRKSQVIDAPIHSLSSSEDVATTAFFLASIRCTVGNGAATLFWFDPWLDGKSVAERAPNLAEVVNKRSRRCRIVQEALQGNTWIRDITGALTIPTIMHYLHLRERAQQVALQPDVHDSFTWCWSTSREYSSRLAYAALHLGQTELLGAKQVEKAKAPKEFKIFMWLVLHDRCWTLERLERHELDNHGPCAFCDHNPEFIDHLLLYCVFSHEVWLLILHRFHW
jgi:hypothetical protein